MPEDLSTPRRAVLRPAVRIGLGGFILFAGLAHLFTPEAFYAQTPLWLPARDAVILVSGGVEIALGLALLGPARLHRPAGWATAAFLLAVTPGNLYQFLAGVDGFGLDTPTARFVRLLGQPLLILAALWGTGAWPQRRSTTDGAERTGDAGGPGNPGPTLQA